MRWVVVAVAATVLVVPALIMVAFSDDPEIEPTITSPEEDPRTGEVYHDVPPAAQALYQDLGRTYEVPWTLLAALADRATDHGRQSPYDDEQRSATTGVPEPRIGGGDGEAVGPLLLTPTAAERAANPHSLQGSVTHIAQELSDAATSLEADGHPRPRADHPDDTGVADELWGAALDQVTGQMALDGGEVSCGLPSLEPDEPEVVGAWVDAVWRCELDHHLLDGGELFVVTEVGDGDRVELTGADAADQLREDALEVSYLHSGWDADTCPIFPGIDEDTEVSPSSPSPTSSGGIDDLCDVEDVARAAATVVISRASTPVADRDAAHQSFGWEWVPFSDVDITDDLGRAAEGVWADRQLDEVCHVEARGRLLGRITDYDLFTYDLADLESIRLGGSGDLRGDAGERDDALEDAGLLGDASVGAELDECPTDPLQWEGHLYDVVEDVHTEMLTRAQQDIAGNLEHDNGREGDGDNGGSGDADASGDGADPDAELPTGVYEGEDVTRWQFYADLVGGVKRHLDQAGRVTSLTDPATGPPLERLNPDPHREVRLPPWERVRTGQGQQRTTDRVLSLAVGFGGLYPGDPRAGDRVHRGDGAFSCPASDEVWRNASPNPSNPREVAELIYEVFYCHAADLGLDQQGVQFDGYNAREDGIHNKAQLIASEAVVVGWCESVGFEYHDRANQYDYAGIFQMGEWEMSQYGPSDDRFNVADNIIGAARYFQYGVERGHRWDGWGPWAVINTDYGGPNKHVTHPAVPRFASTRSDHQGARGPNLPAWAVNPFQDEFPESYNATNGCPATSGSDWPEIDGLVAQAPNMADAFAFSGELTCPIDPTEGSLYYVHDWGAPRGGGARQHNGLDVFADHGVPIRSPVDGIVARDSTGGNGGLALYVQDPDTLDVWVFRHNQENLAQPGDTVTQGEVIALVGSTGNASPGSPHAHTEYYPENEWSTDPYPVLEPVCGASRGAADSKDLSYEGANTYCTHSYCITD